MGILPDPIMLGVDPGFGTTGFAVMKREQGKVIILDYGHKTMSPKDSLSRRTGIFYDLFSEKIKTLGVSHVTLETSFLGKNAQTFLKLGYLRGLLYLLADQHSLDISEFAPREIKLAVTGFGGADKDQVHAMIVKHFPILVAEGRLTKHDTTDALAVCLCGLWNYYTNNTLAARLAKVQGLQ